MQERLGDGRGVEADQGFRRQLIRSPWNSRLVDLFHAVAMAIACLIAYWMMTYGLPRLFDKPPDFLGGVWAANCDDLRIQGYSS
jgi:hypothetical protein